jgi:hypothetical protein
MSIINENLNEYLNGCAKRNQLTWKKNCKNGLARLDNKELILVAPPHDLQLVPFTLYIVQIS